MRMGLFIFYSTWVTYWMAQLMSSSCWLFWRRRMGWRFWWNLLIRNVEVWWFCWWLVVCWFGLMSCYLPCLIALPVCIIVMMRSCYHSHDLYLYHHPQQPPPPRQPQSPHNSTSPAIESYSTNRTETFLTLINRQSSIC